jgi:preprotein translocase subunit SecA
MTIEIDEAIKHCEEVAEEYEKQVIWLRSKEGNPNCEHYVAHAKEHRQLAEWLKELKALREFARYVAYSITAEEEEFDENPRFFGEAYCRKLHKLGIIKSVDNKWVYDEKVKAND